MPERTARRVAGPTPARSALRRSVAGAALSLAAVMALTGGVAAVPPPPPNPSDNQIDTSRDTARERAGDVGRVTNQLADAQSRLDDLAAGVELKRENANKALVDMRTAQDAARRARRAANDARSQADASGRAIEKARRDLDAFAEGSYEQGSTIGSMSAYIGARNPQNFLERAQLLGAVSGSKLNALDSLQRARTEKSNKDSAARAALQNAQRKQAAAEDAKTAADQARSAAITAQQNQAARTRGIADRKAQLEQQLNAAQARVGGLTDARKRYNSWLAAKQAEEQRQQQEAAAAAASAASSASSGESDGDSAGSSSSDSSSSDSAGSGDEDSADSGSSDSEPATDGSVADVIERAKSALGTPYVWAGGDTDGATLGGFDCSGLMVYAFAAAGISLPHYSGYQYEAGQHVPLSEKQPGDMVFYGNDGIHHVAMYLGDGMMIEAPQTGLDVRITSLRYDDILPYATRML